MDPINIIQWTKKGADPITLSEPQYRAKAYYDTRVYDLLVIRDMLSRLGGALPDHGHELKAKRRASH